MALLTPDSLSDLATAIVAAVTIVLVELIRRDTPVTRAVATRLRAARRRRS